jgi:hypothetical protein
MYEEKNVNNHILLTLTLAGREWSALHLNHFSQGKEPPASIRHMIRRAPEPVGMMVERRKILPLPGLEL